ncbi:MAG: hypothetical protein IPM01_14775 [Burkholderiaceae bacterium]|nr:hypothetical protein [Burkholderiaceae bacterium]
MAWRGMPLFEAIALGQLVQPLIAADGQRRQLMTGRRDVVAGLSVGVMMERLSMLVGQRWLGAPGPTARAGGGRVLLIAAAAFVREGTETRFIAAPFGHREPAAPSARRPSPSLLLQDAGWSSARAMAALS